MNKSKLLDLRPNLSLFFVKKKRQLGWVDHDHNTGHVGTHTKTRFQQPFNYLTVDSSCVLPQSMDFLTHLEIYLSKRDGLDKLLKIARYAAKIVVASAILDRQPLVDHLSSFESSVGVSRKAFRLGKFIHNINALRATDFTPHFHWNYALSVAADSGEGLYYFIEQFVWLAKTGLIDNRRLPALQKFSAWCELVGYFGSIGLQMIQLRKLDEDERCLTSTIEVAELREIRCTEEQAKLRKLQEKKMMMKLSVVQDFADGLSAMADIQHGRGRLSAPLLVSVAGLLSAVISTHKNWVSC